MLLNRLSSANAAAASARCRFSSWNGTCVYVAAEEGLVSATAEESGDDAIVTVTTSRK
jgi:hypothetical protein